MPGIDPSVLQQIANTGQAYPGSPPNPVETGAGEPVEPPKAEPVALHEMCEAAMEALGIAKQAFDDLAAQAQMADNIDPKIEKAITDNAMKLSEISDSLEDIEEQLEGARRDHEDMVSGKSDKQAPGARMPPLK